MAIVTGSFTLIFCIFIAGWLQAFVDVIVNPFRALIRKLTLLQHSEIELAVDVEYKNTSSDIHFLYDSFSNLSMTLKFTSNKQNDTDETLSLLNYANAYQMFKGKNEKAMGICMNNIGNIHFRARRFNEAAKAYEEAIEIAKKMVEE